MGGHYGIIQAYTKQCTSLLFTELTLKKITTTPVVHTLTKGEIIDTIAETPNEWTLSFQLYPKAKDSTTSNIIRFTNMNSFCCDPADLWIYMELLPDSYLIRFYAVTTEWDLSDMMGVVDS